MICEAIWAGFLSKMLADWSKAVVVEQLLRAIGWLGLLTLQQAVQDGGYDSVELSNSSGGTLAAGDNLGTIRSPELVTLIDAKRRPRGLMRGNR